MAKRGLNLPSELLPAQKPTPPLWKRGLAFILDLLLIDTIILSPFDSLVRKIIPGLATGKSLQLIKENPEMFQHLYLVLAVAIIPFLLYFILLEWKFGQTIGQRLFGIGVKSEKNSLTLWQAIVSNLTFIPFFPFIILWVVDPIHALFSPTNQRFMEKIVNVTHYDMKTEKRKQKKQKSPWLKMAVTVALLYLLSLLAVTTISMTEFSLAPGDVAKIRVHGVITTEAPHSFSTQFVSSEDIIDFIDDADKNPMVKAILLDINSPGGSAVASQAVANALKRTDKKTYALIHEVGASGGYWIASATDEIIASELSVTGSIGVISSYLEFSRLFEKYGINYERLVAGEYKDTGTPFRQLDEEERAILQSKLDKVHDYFIDAVAENRNLSREYVQQSATGLFYLGVEAQELGLVDHLGDEETVKELIKQEFNITDVTFYEYRRKLTLFEALSSVISDQSFSLGLGLGESFTAALQPEGLRT